MTVLSPVRAERTTLVAIGVEQYAAGALWNLAGPASDAARFVDWFASHGVLAERSMTFLSALPGPPAPGTVTGPADHESVRTALLRTVPALEGDLLVVVWGGHGLVSGTGHRHLFTADMTAADPVNLNLDALLRFYRSSAVPSFRQQLWIVDACQSVHDVRRSRLELPDEDFGARDAVPVEQEVLLAASLGERAANLPGERTGLFSREVLRRLRELDTFPPDVPRLARELAEHFTALRKQGAANQTPAYLWVKDRGGHEGQLHLRPSPARAGAARPVHAPRRAPSTVVTALAAVPGFTSLGVRDLLVASLPPQIAARVNRNPAARPEAMSLVMTCWQLQGGMEELLQSVQDCIGDGPEVDALARAVAEATGV